MNPPRTDKAAPIMAPMRHLNARATALVALLSLASIAPAVSGESAADTAALEKENVELQQRLAALQERLKEEEQYSYVVSKGMIVGAENVYMETMELTDAKQWCNSNAQCKGFTFLAPLDGSQQPEDEVTITFKGEGDDGPLKVEPDTSCAPCPRPVLGGCLRLGRTRTELHRPRVVVPRQVHFVHQALGGSFGAGLRRRRGHAARRWLLVPRRPVARLRGGRTCLCARGRRRLLPPPHATR